MKITFTLTKQDAWNCHKYITRKSIQRHPVKHLVKWILVYVILWLCLAGFSHLFEKDFLLCLAMSFIQCSVGAIGYPFGLRRRFFKDLAKTSNRIGERVVESGKFDLYWGYIGGSGYYYHWSRFDELFETADYLYLTIASKGTFIIPKSAYSDPAEAQAFVAEVRARWEAMKQRQRYQMQESAGAWPPAPRING